MVTKKVTACIVKGMLVGTLLPGCTVLNRTSAQVLNQGAKSRVKSPVSHSEDFVSANQKPQPEVTTPAQNRRPLGTFTMRAYTQYASRRARTASGTVPTHGRTIAVDPRVIPLGTVVEIEGVGKRVAEDTGGSIKGKQLDLFLPSTQACTQFGVRSRKVYIVD